MKDFGDVYGEYWDLVYGFLFRLCQNEHFAEELAQETQDKPRRDLLDNSGRSLYLPTAIDT